MSRILFWLGLLCVLYLLIRERIYARVRRVRGQPAPQRPKYITLIAIAVVLIYGLLIGYRLYIGDSGAPG